MQGIPCQSSGWDCTFIAKDPGSVPCWGTRILQAAQRRQKKKRKKKDLQNLLLGIDKHKKN